MTSSSSDTYNQNPIPRARFTGIFIPAEILEMSELAPMDMMLLSWIDSLYCPEHGGCFASNDYLGEKLNLKSKTISEIVSKLVKLELVEKVSFDGRVRIIRACKEKWYSRKADSGLNRKLHPAKTGSSILPKPESHYIYSKEEIKEQLPQEVVVVVEDEIDEQVQKMSSYLKRFSQVHGPDWDIPIAFLRRLISVNGFKYVTNQLNYMAEQQAESWKDEKATYKKNKTSKIEKPKKYLERACKENWADSEHKKE
jgi:hypothetical protein